MKKIVITGFSGVLSRSILSYISQNYIDVEVVGIARHNCNDINLENLIPIQHSLDLVKCDRSNIEQFGALCSAIKDADLLIHTAAMKRITDCEELPFQAIQTNILATQNLIDASIESGVKKIVNISSDMAVEPIGVYGATKLLQSKLIVNAFKTTSICTCNIRLGNIFTKAGGTILHFFRSKYEQTGALPITNPQMSRFAEIDSRVVELIFELSKMALGGEIFIPKFKSYDILTAATAISDDAKIDIVGMRQGEKLFEIMVSQNEWQSVIENDSYYVVVPQFNLLESYKLHHGARSVLEKFSLTSENNLNRYSKDELRYVMEQLGLVASEKIP